jgi:hypothetical protein
VLVGDLAAVRGELARVDSKCATLAALAGAAAAYAAGQAGHGPAAARAVVAFAGVAFAATVLVLLLTVLRPRLIGAVGFCRWADLSAGEISEHARQRAAARLRGPDRARAADAEALRVLSVLTRAKYQRLRLAVDLAAAGVMLLAVAAIAAAAS